MIVDGGQKYISGDISVSGGGGSNFSATFAVDAGGSISLITISDYGKQYTATPSSVNVLYPGTALFQASHPRSLTPLSCVLRTNDALGKLK